MATAEERKARNEAVFRDANEEIQSARAKLPALGGKVPFFCECDDPSCREVVRLGTDEYEAVRANPAAFLIARNHLDGHGDPIAEHDGYAVVEKQGVARTIALETDPRGEHG